MWRAGESASASELTEIMRALRDLEKRLRSLGPAAKSDAREAGGALTELLSETLSDLADRLRERARGVGGEAARVGSDAIRRVEEEVGNRPLMTLAVAAGIGFLLGFLNRR
jgi:ElaB/YqjD/DUF883 family membrane-anchored ribosome-binding protein